MGKGGEERIPNVLRSVAQKELPAGRGMERECITQRQLCKIAICRINIENHSTRRIGKHGELETVSKAVEKIEVVVLKKTDDGITVHICVAQLINSA